MGASDGYGGYQDKKGTSIWVWLGGGCLVAVVLVVLAVGGLGWYGYRWAKSMEAEQKDPAARDAKARTILGVETLPEGYYVSTAISVPMLADIVLMSDVPPGKDGHRPEFGERGLIYLRTIKLGSQNAGELEDYFAGKTQDSEVLRRNHIDLQADKVIARGVIEGDPKLLYLVQRGTLDYRSMGPRKRLVTLVLPRCPDTKKSRIGIWYGPDLEAAADDPAQLAGTNGDVARITEFFAQFQLCR